MAKVINLTNGVSFGAIVTVTSADVTATKVEVEFVGVSGNKPEYKLAYAVSIFRSGVNVMEDATITISGSKITIEDGGTTYQLTANDEIHIIAQRGVEA